MDSVRAGRRLAFIVTLLILGVITMACRNEEPDIAPTATAPAPAVPTTASEVQSSVPSEAQSAGEAYPPPPAATATGGPYPPPTATLIPLDPYPGEAEEPSGVLLALGRPLHPGDTTVSGVGPAGISVIVRDITDMGVVLGQAVIGQDGTFTVDVEPLPEGIRVGLTTGDANAVEDGIRPGQGAISVPQVGYFYDSVMVRQEQ